MVLESNTCDHEDIVGYERHYMTELANNIAENIWNHLLVWSGKTPNIYDNVIRLEIDGEEIVVSVKSYPKMDVMDH